MPTPSPLLVWIHAHGVGTTGRGCMVHALDPPHPVAEWPHCLTQCTHYIFIMSLDDIYQVTFGFKSRSGCGLAPNPLQTQLSFDCMLCHALGVGQYLRKIPQHRMCTYVNAHVHTRTHTHTHTHTHMHSHNF
mmetsp:Transcript_6360/g.11311  ORF Transcript_6360/g.11311 Transcript_6360/m.11311 type:complete len:132 (-) Transcript_6360:8-403(-)